MQLPGCHVWLRTWANLLLFSDGGWENCDNSHTLSLSMWRFFPTLNQQRNMDLCQECKNIDIYLDTRKQHFLTYTENHQYKFLGSCSKHFLLFTANIMGISKVGWSWDRTTQLASTPELHLKPACSFKRHEIFTICLVFLGRLCLKQSTTKAEKTVSPTPMIRSDLQTLYMINILNTTNNLPNNVAIFLFNLYIKFYKTN